MNNSCPQCAICHHQRRQNVVFQRSSLLTEGYIQSTIQICCIQLKWQALKVIVKTSQRCPIYCHRKTEQLCWNAWKVMQDRYCCTAVHIQHTHKRKLHSQFAVHQKQAEHQSSLKKKKKRSEIWAVLECWHYLLTPIPLSKRHCIIIRMCKLTLTSVCEAKKKSERRKYCMVVYASASMQSECYAHITTYDWNKNSNSCNSTVQTPCSSILEGQNWKSKIYFQCT